ncbi:MAG: caspase family protein [Balneola sp.]
MYSIRLKLFLVLLICVGSACSSSKWVVENQYETDRNDFELLSSTKFLERSGATNPNSPIVTFQLRAENRFEYAQRVKTDRYIQRYRPTWRSVLLGLVGAGVASTAAVTVSESNTSQNILFGTAGFITLTSFLNMKPVGEPTPTGESRLLRKTGSIEETEVVRANPEPGLVARYSIFHKGEILVGEKLIESQNSSYSINLIEDLNPEIFEYDSSDAIELEVYFNDKIYTELIPLRNIFESFAVVSSQVTALRDEPVFNSRNILTDLAFGSQMKLVSEDSLWYKVLYGISETWISKTDAYPIWRPSQFASQLSIITIPNIPFGNVDVESNIPVLKTGNDSTFVFMLSNGEYQDTYSERSYAERDLRLMEEYFENALGIPSSNIDKASNIDSQQRLNLAYNRFANKLRRPQKQLIVYLSGYSTVNENGEVGMISTQPGRNPAFNLNNLLNSLSEFPIEEIVVLADLDPIETDRDGGVYESLSQSVFSNNQNSIVIFGSSENQQSRDYSVVNGDQKRHSIFTYFVADAMKNRQGTVSGIINHLQRNVDYTSRRLHNRPQNVIYFGDTSISLID